MVARLSRATVMSVALLAASACRSPQAPASVSTAAPIRNLTGPGIIRATAATAVRTKEEGTIGKAWFPIPLLTAHQVPLTFEIATDPPAALKGWRWQQREDGVNWLCEADLAPGPRGATVRWTSLVLVDLEEPTQGASWRPLSSLPPVALPTRDRPLDAPDAAAEWTRSTACVQSSDAAITREAKELADDATDLESYVKHVIRFTSTNQGNGAPFVSLDAKAALACGGSCTSRANLAAALLRARGIPARTSAHLPTWSGPLYEHWLVEYWHPGAGWIWIEPSKGQMRPSPCSLVVLNVANASDEDEAFSWQLPWSNVMPGAARLSVHEHSRDLESDWALSDGAPNQATAEWRIVTSSTDFATLFTAAREAHGRLAHATMAGRAAEARTQRIHDAIAARDRTQLVAALAGTE